MNHSHDNYGIWLILLGILIYTFLCLYCIIKMMCLYLRNGRRMPRSMNDIKCIPSTERKEFEQAMKRFRRVGIVGIIALLLLTVLISALNTEWKL